MTRRTFVKSVAAFAGMMLLPLKRCTWAAPGPFSPEVMEKRKALLDSFRETIKSFLRQNRLPMIDVEFHWGKIPLTEIISKMDRNGIALTWLGPVERKGNHASLEACSKYPGRFVPTIMHGDQERWHGKDLTLVEEIAADAMSGEYFAMGEFEARHYISSTNNRNIHMPMDSDSFHGIFKAAEETGIPFLVHHEAEDAMLPEMEKMLSLYPNAPVVWCHVGRNTDPKTWIEFPTPNGVRKFIQKYPNLYFDVLGSGPGSVQRATGVHDNLLYEHPNGPPKLKPEWRSLFNVYADRFLIGSDTNSGRWPEYDEVMSRLRTSVLGELEPKAAEKIAFKNAWKMMSGEEWV